MNKIIIKSLLASAILILGAISYSTKVGLYDIQIKYGVVPDAFNNVSIQQLKDTKESLNIPTKVVSQEPSIDSDLIVERIFNESVSEASHGVADNFSYNGDLYKQICESNKDICNFVYFNGDFSEKDKVSYIGIIIFIIKKIDANLVTNNNIKNTLYSLRLNKSQEGRRGLAGHHTITINLKTISTKKEFSEVLTHELGHIIDLGVLKGSSDEKDLNFTEFERPSFSVDDSSIRFYELNWNSEKTRKSRSSFKDFTSGYGMSDPFEDFAECVNLYLNHYLVFEEMAQNNYIVGQKFSFMKDLFGDNYIFTDNKNYKKAQKDPLRRPWDTTKMN